MSIDVDFEPLGDVSAETHDSSCSYLQKWFLFKCGQSPWIHALIHPFLQCVSISWEPTVCRDMLTVLPPLAQWSSILQYTFNLPKTIKPIFYIVTKNLLSTFTLNQDSKACFYLKKVSKKKISKHHKMLLHWFCWHLGQEEEGKFIVWDRMSISEPHTMSLLFLLPLEMSI